MLRRLSFIVPRLSIYGRRLSEWDKLARWFYTNRLAHKNVRWMIQIPRLYHIYKKNGEVLIVPLYQHPPTIRKPFLAVLLGHLFSSSECCLERRPPVTMFRGESIDQVRVFADMINNIFAPLFEISANPDANIALHTFLKTVVGFDSVDDESKRETVQLHSDRCCAVFETYDGFGIYLFRGFTTLPNHISRYRHWVSLTSTGVQWLISAGTSLPQRSGTCLTTHRIHTGATMWHRTSTALTCWGCPR